MEKFNIYSYMCHFYQTAGPFYDDLLVKIEDRRLSSLPLDGIYRFRFFNSKMDIDTIYNIINGINDIEVLKYIKNITNLSKWYYIGDELIGDEKAKLIQLYKPFNDTYEKMINAEKIIDPKIQTIDPIILDDLNNIEKIYDTSYREKSKILTKDLDVKNRKWL